MDKTNINRGILLAIIILTIVLYVRIQKESPLMQKTWIIPFEIVSSLIIGVILKIAFKKVQNG